MENENLLMQHSKNVSTALNDNHSQHKNEEKVKIDLLESPDDFEHLGNDSSSRDENNKSDVKDILESFTSTARDFAAEINKEADKVIEDIFDPLKRSTTPSNVTVAESNLLEMGDSVPERVEHKLDTFLSEFKTDSGFQKTEHFPLEGSKNIGIFDEIKSTTQNFMDFEREKIDNIKKDIVHGFPVKEIVTESTVNDIKGDSDVIPTLTDPFNINKKEEKRESEMDEPVGSLLSYSSVSAPLDVSPKLPSISKVEEGLDKPLETEAQRCIKELKKSVEDVKVIDQKKNELSKKAGSKNEDQGSKFEKQEVQKEVLEKNQVDKVLESKTKLEAEALFCNLGLDAWFRPNQLNPRVESLIYWRDPKKSGPVFASVLAVLLALTYFSLISVVAYLSLLVLTGTVSFRIYKNVVQAVQKTGDGHPFKEILETDVGLPQDKTKEISEVLVANINGALHELRRLFLVEDLIDSIKFGVFLWCMTYLGAWFNGMTLVIIAWVALFTLPKVYEMNKTQIDNNLQLVKSKLAEVTSKVKAAIPIGKKEEKKDQ